MVISIRLALPSSFASASLRLEGVGDGSNKWTYISILETEEVLGGHSVVLRFLVQSAVRGYYRPAHCMERPEMQWRNRKNKT